jgi:hypothetical protein
LVLKWALQQLDQALESFRNMNSGTQSDSIKSAGRLALWLGAGLLLAGFYTGLELSGISGVGLGWAVKPGFWILLLIVVLAGIETKRTRTFAIIQVLLCLLAAIFLEFLSLPRPTDSYVRIVLALLGISILFSGVKKIHLSEVLLLLVSSYIQSVCFWNLFCLGQMMYFFKAGWTF